MSSSSFNEIQEQPLTGIMDALASIESGVVDEDTEKGSVLADSTYSIWKAWELERERERLAWERFDRAEPEREREARREDRERHKVDLERIFVITNFVLELPSAVFDQLSSVRRPQFALLSMLMSFAALFICITELVYKCRKEKLTCKWRGTLPWLYYPSRNHKPFGSFKDIIGLVCAICQCVVTQINYNFCLRRADNPIKISVWPIIFSFGLLCSKFLGNRERSSTIEKKDDEII